MSDSTSTVVESLIDLKLLTVKDFSSMKTSLWFEDRLSLALELDGVVGGVGGVGFFG